MSLFNCRELKKVALTHFGYSILFFYCIFNSKKIFIEIISDHLISSSILSSEGQNFEQLNFRMANISNLKINERLNVERPNLRVTTIENENREDKASKFIYIKGQIWESAKLREYRMNRKFQNLIIFGISIVFRCNGERKKTLTRLYETYENSQFNNSKF